MCQCQCSVEVARAGTLLYHYIGSCELWYIDKLGCSIILCYIFLAKLWMNLDKIASTRKKRLLTKCYISLSPIQPVSLSEWLIMFHYIMIFNILTPAHCRSIQYWDKKIVLLYNVFSALRSVNSSIHKSFCFNTKFISIDVDIMSETGVKGVTYILMHDYFQPLIMKLWSTPCIVSYYNVLCNLVAWPQDKSDDRIQQTRIVGYESCTQPPKG